MTPRRILPLFFLLLAAPGAVRSPAQTATDSAMFLVARPKLPDPVFQQSVVLMLPQEPARSELLLGLIINKPMRITLSTAFPEEHALRARGEPVYFGGPVDVDAPAAVFRASKPPKGAVHLFADLYASFDRDSVVDLLKKSAPNQDVRVFMGRAQWIPEQLRMEMTRDAWYAERDAGDTESGWIFSPDPQSVWQTVLDKAKPKTIAGLPQALRMLVARLGA